MNETALEISIMLTGIVGLGTIGSHWYLGSRISDMQRNNMEKKIEEQGEALKEKRELRNDVREEIRSNIQTSIKDSFMAMQHGGILEQLKKR